VLGGDHHRHDDAGMGRGRSRDPRLGIHGNGAILSPRSPAGWALTSLRRDRPPNAPAHAHEMLIEPAGVVPTRDAMDYLWI